MADGLTSVLLLGMMMCGLLLHISKNAADGNKYSRKPNFIIILADDIGWADLDANVPESKTNNTPHLNLMAEEGLRFTDFHSPASTCSPSRAAILTGRYGLRNGVTHNFAVGSVAGLPLSEVTLPQLLQRAGYFTAMIGKWHLGHNGPYRPNKRGHHLSIFDPYDSLDGIVSWVRTSSLSNTGNWLNWTDLPFQSHLTLSASVREWEQECDLALLKITLDKHSNLCLSGFDYYLGVPYSNDMGCTDGPGYNLPQCLPCASPSGIQVIRLKRSKQDGCFSKVGLPLIENSTIVQQPLDLWTLTEQYKSVATRIIQNARERGQPYFLYIALAHMHVPLTPPPGVSATNDGRVYTTSLQEMDGLVGAIKSVSDETARGNTLIWFTGDNGPWEKKCQYAGSVGPFVGKWQTSRGGGSAKQTTWEGGHRVPTIAYWPDRIPANTTSSALLSGMDIFPTLLSLADITPPADRRYDGIDATNILLKGEKSGHKFLFHPNSGAAGTFGYLQTVRMRGYKAFYLTGAAKACDGATGKPQIHDPPLLFDLERDKAEATPLESSAAEYWAVVEQITRRREELLWDIATDRSVSTANYNTDGSAVPCCDPQQAVCRCDTLG